MTKKKEPMFASSELVDTKLKGYYGMEAEQSLQLVNFAPAENPYLNEHYQNDPKDDETDDLL